MPRTMYLQDPGAVFVVEQHIEPKDLEACEPVAGIPSDKYVSHMFGHFEEEMN